MEDQKKYYKIKEIVKKYKLLIWAYKTVLKFCSFFNRKVMYPLVNKRKLGAKLKKIDKINIGCGDDIIEGWLNFGLYSDFDIAYGTTKIINGSLVLNFDATEGLPIDEEAVKYIYASHFIEHLNFFEGISVLERCYKIMKKGGIIRLATPDLELWIKNYCENNVNFFEKYKNLHLTDQDKVLVKTKGEIFMSQVCNWGHKWNYDFESIKHILEKIGFSNITKRRVFESLIPNIEKIEPRGEGRLLESLYVEAIKE